MCKQGHRSEKGQLYTYSQHELHAIRETLQKDRKWKHIDYDTCKKVHSLRLSRRGHIARKNKKNARPRLKESTNHDNLISIEINSVIKQKLTLPTN